MRIFVFAMLLLTSMGCGSDGGGSSSNGKDLFNVWTRDDQALSFDIRGASFNITFDMSFALSTGETCICDTVISGNQSSGSVSVTSCSYDGGGSGDPDCAGLWENGGSAYTYSKSGNVLTLCNDPSDCGAYY